ncbi:MAG TPA: hypothetical protein PK156_27235 [Polyangium sp.]|nr:hypothetical protein [Polyangium sp.]
MKRFLSTFAAPAVLITLATSCDQPKPSCTVGVGGFAAKYNLKAGQTACPDIQGQDLRGEILGLMAYNPLKEGEKYVQDYNKATLAIRSNQLGTIATDPMLKDDANNPTSLGAFQVIEPDENDVCYVPTLSPALQDVPANGTNPATQIKYEWSDVKVYVTTAYPGTQMVGALKYTNGSCTATYDVMALWPAVSCAGEDADGNAIAVPALCDPVADPASGRATGSGINPDLEARVACDPDILLCVLTAPPDQLK